ncbi:MAG: hypothetical protein DMF74_05810, partial [Acidobacteria bacterium]
GHTGLPIGYVLKLWLAAAVGTGFGWAIKLAIGVRHPVIVATLVLVPYGLAYFAISSALKVSEANAVVGRVLGFVGIRTR